MATKSQTATKKPRPTMAIHSKPADGIHVVGIGDLRVVIVPDGDSWFAQGLEIDYAAQGSSVEDVKKRFEDGLVATIQEHLRIYGDIERILKVSPTEVWSDILLSAGASPKRLTVVSVYRVEKKSLPKEMSRFPFDGINYFEAACSS